MAKYLLSTYRVEGDVPGAPGSPEEMKAFMERVMAVEDELEAAGAFVFGGALDSPDRAGVANVGETIVTDGPFAEAKEQIAGFYIIDAGSDEEARTWGRKVAEATNHPIEVRGFSASGRIRDTTG